MRSAVLTAAYRHWLRPGLFRAYGADPERVHEAVIRALGVLGATPAAAVMKLLAGAPASPVRVAGVWFPGRVGVAAGLDKDGVAARSWAPLGFGFAELGTVTASAQPGNPRPRVFRLADSRALINRMGFNNLGANALAHRLAAWGVRRGENTLGLPLGVSIGKTRTVPLDQAAADYVQSLTAVHRYADYVAVNVSSPNTAGLRHLQDKGLLADLVAALVAAAASLDPVPVPIFVKVAPDLSDEELDGTLEASLGAGAAGFVAANTTLARTGLRPPDQRYARQSGGLSGAPLTRRSREVVARTVRAGLPVIASGGIMSPGDAEAMLDLGAAAVQVFTGFIFSGPGLVAGINARCAVAREPSRGGSADDLF